jgi:hypothetical protein
VAGPLAVKASVETGVGAPEAGNVAVAADVAWMVGCEISFVAVGVIVISGVNATGWQAVINSKESANKIKPLFISHLCCWSSFPRRIV